jgi:hypothetical protein
MLQGTQFMKAAWRAYMERPKAMGKAIEAVAALACWLFVGALCALCFV